MPRALLLLPLIACGSPEPITLSFSQPLEAEAIGSMEVFVLLGNKSCADLGAGPYLDAPSLPILQRAVLTRDALRLDALPTTERLVFVADAYAQADAVGPVIGSACNDAVKLKPGGRVSVELRF